MLGGMKLAAYRLMLLLIIANVPVAMFCLAQIAKAVVGTYGVPGLLVLLSPSLLFLSGVWLLDPRQQEGTRPFGSK